VSGQLQRLVLDFRTGELVVRCLYRSSSGPGTKARRRGVAALTRSGLTQALEAPRGRGGRKKNFLDAVTRACVTACQNCRFLPRPLILRPPIPTSVKQR
jgi:hypothetical protein